MAIRHHRFDPGYRHLLFLVFQRDSMGSITVSLRKPTRHPDTINIGAGCFVFYSKQNSGGFHQLSLRDRVCFLVLLFFPPNFFDFIAITVAGNINRTSWPAPTIFKGILGTFVMLSAASHFSLRPSLTFLTSRVKFGLDHCTPPRLFYIFRII